MSKINGKAKGNARKGTVKGKASAKVAAKVAAKGKAAPKGKASAKVAKGDAGYEASATVIAAREAAKVAGARLTGTTKIVKVNLDAFRDGSDVRKRFAKVKVGATVGSLTEAGIVSHTDLACALAKGRIAIKGK